MKRKCWLILPLLILLLLTGCGRTVELKDRLLVQAVGVDWQDDAFLLTLQVFQPDEGGEGAFNPGKSNSGVYQASGRTILEALGKVENTSGKTIFLGSNQLLVVGEELAGLQMGEAISYFNGNHQTRPRVFVAVAEGRAADLVDIEIQQGIVPAEAMAKSIQLSIRGGNSLPCSLMDVVRVFQGSYSAVGVPFLRYSQDFEGKDTFQVDGTALLRDDVLVGSLTREETQGAAWFLGEVHQRDLTLEDETGNRYTVKVCPQRRKVRCEIVEDRPVFHLELSVRCSVPETLGDVRFLATNEETAQLTELVERAIREEAGRALQACLWRYQADPFDFQQVLEKYQARWWREHAEEWPQLLNECKVTLGVKVEIQNLGLGATTQ